MKSTALYFWCTCQNPIRAIFTPNWCLKELIINNEKKFYKNDSVVEYNPNIISMQTFL